MSEYPEGTLARDLERVRLAFRDLGRALWTERRRLVYFIGTAWAVVLLAGIATALL